MKQTNKRRSAAGQDSACDAFVLSLDKEISLSELKSLMEKSKNLLLVDVRSTDEVDRGRIPGSIHIPGEQQPIIPCSTATDIHLLLQES